MLLTNTPTLSDALIQQVTEQPGITANALHASLSHHQPVTIQAVYKALRKLRTEEVLMHIKGAWYVNTRWLMGLARWAGTHQHTQIPRLQATGMLPIRPGERKRFLFDDVLLMDAFWGHMLNLVAAITKPPVHLYAYNAHVWFYLVHGVAEEQYHKNMEDLGVHIHFVVGSKSPLDLWNKTVTPVAQDWHFHPIPLFEKTPHRAFNSIGDYFFTIEYAREHAARLHRFFERTPSIDQVDHAELRALFYEPHACSFTVTKHNKQAEVFERKIGKFFT